MICNSAFLWRLPAKPIAVALPRTKPRFLQGSTGSSVSILTPAHGFSQSRQKHKGFQAQVNQAGPIQSGGSCNASSRNGSPTISDCQGCQPPIISGVTLPYSFSFQLKALRYTRCQRSPVVTPDSFYIKIQQQLL